MFSDRFLGPFGSKEGILLRVPAHVETEDSEYENVSILVPRCKHYFMLYPNH